MDVILNEKYRTTVSVTEGRAGRAMSDDGALDVTLRSQGNPSGTDPEQLLAAGWGACLLGELNAVARTHRVAVGDVVLDVEVSLGTTSAERSALRVRFVARSALLPSDTLLDLLHQAHGRCPYSRATAGNISVQLEAQA